MVEKILKEIDNYKHIVIVVDDATNVGCMASANALYTYLLQLHKKVSLYTQHIEYSLNLLCLPWIDKLKTSYPSSADIELKAISSVKMFNYFQKNMIKLNHKMATSLYAGLLYETKGFQVNILDNNIFIMAQKLLDSNADIELCTKSILNHQSLSVLRFKALLLNRMLLKEEATLAVFEIDDKDLKKTGAKIEDVSVVIDEALSLPTVTNVKVIYNKKLIRNKYE